jgi:hypothetical protein
MGTPACSTRERKQHAGFLGAPGPEDLNVAARGDDCMEQPRRSFHTEGVQSDSN